MNYLPPWGKSGRKGPMTCKENGCLTVLTDENTFVLPLATLAEKAKKQVIIFIKADLLRGAICAECAFIAATIGEEYVSLTDALAEVKRLRDAHENALKAAQDEVNAKKAARCLRRKALEAAAEENIRKQARSVAIERGAQNLGVLLMAAAPHFRPSARLAPAKSQQL